jgi:nucleoside-diphosphate-sugar epimerase
MAFRKKILVLGAMGAVGNQIFLNLKNRKYKVNGLTSKKNLDSAVIKTNYLKMNNRAKHLIFDADIIINCIGENTHQTEMEFKNIIILSKIIKYINRKKKITFIHISTCGVYGHLTVNEISEKVIPNPFTHYAKTKYAGEELLVKNLKKNVSLFILRSSQILGKGMPNTSLKKLGFFIKKKLFVYLDNKKCVFSYIFIDDLFIFIVGLFNKKTTYYEIFNTSNYSTYESIVNNYLKIYGIKKNFFSINKKVSYFLFNLIIYIFKFYNFIFKSHFQINTSTYASLMSNTIFNSNKIKKYLNISALKKINTTTLKELYE